MTDSYQAIYDAVRSRISNGDIGAAIEAVAFRQLDISNVVVRAQEQVYCVAYEYMRPFVLLKPKLYPDGNMWCALYGENIHDGVAGFGETPALAAQNFDENWNKLKLPPATKDGERG